LALLGSLPLQALFYKQENRLDGPETLRECC